MTGIAVIFDSATGRTEGLARAVAHGAAELSGTSVTLARIGSTTPGDGLVPATPALLAAADGIALGTPVHFGAPSASMMGFLAETGEQWQELALAGRVATVFAGAGSGGGSETALAALWPVLAVHGLVILPGSPRAASGAGSASPLGSATLATSDPSARDAEHARARAQGHQLARIAQALSALRR